MSDDLDSTVRSARGEGPSSDFVAALRERIVAESRVAPRAGIAPVTELEIKPLREQGMTTTRKLTIGLVAAAIVVVAGLAAIANSGDSDGLVVTDQSTETSSTSAATTTTAEPTTTTTTTATTVPPTESSEPATTEAEVAALREAVLNLEGRERQTDAFSVAVVFCDDPQVESRIPLATGNSDAYIDMYSPDRGSAEFLEFGSEADRDTHFAAVENGRSLCKGADDETYITEQIETDSGRLLIYSARGPNNSGGHFPPFYFHVSTVGATGMLSVRAESIEAVNAILAELELA